MLPDEFNKIKAGMSYAEVTEIVGSYGNEEANTDIEGYTEDIYSWVGNGSTGAKAAVPFENGQVIAKAQIGLK